MDLSVVIPVFNEEESILPLYETVIGALNRLCLGYEIVIVDDGSTDKTFETAFKLAQNDPRLKIIQLNRNYGQSASLNAGIEHAKGKFIVTMDGDLQNDPRDIERLLSKINEGYDLVLGWRKNRKDNYLLRKLPSQAANALIRIVTGTEIKDQGCAMRICRSEVIKQFDIYSDMHRYLPVIATLAGARMTQIEVKHFTRKFGKSKYGLSRIYKVVLDLIAVKTIITGFYRPLSGFGPWAIISALISLIFILISFALLFLNPAQSVIIPLGISLLLAALSMFLLVMGFISDLAYHTSSRKIIDIANKTKGAEANYNESKFS